MLRSYEENCHLTRRTVLSYNLNERHIRAVYKLFTEAVAEF